MKYPLYAWLFFRLFLSVSFCSPPALALGSESEGYYVFFKKPSDWKEVYFYTWFGQPKRETSGPWPGKALTEADGWYRGFVEKNSALESGQAINIVWSNGAGQQTPDLQRSAQGWYIWKDKDQVVNRWSDSNPDKNLALGAERFASLCASCHGPQGQGKVGPSLLLSDGRCPSCQGEQTLIDRISRTMPPGAPGTCQGACALAVSRYIRLELNSSDTANCEGPVRGRRQLRLLSKREYRNTIESIFGISDLAALRSWPEPPSVQGYENNADASVVSDRHVLVFAQAAEEIAARVSLEDVAGASCAGDSTCLIKTASELLFRAPLSAASLENYLRLWSPAGGKKVLLALLQAPQFVYRSELGTFIAPKNAFELSPYEIAAAMSYGLTGYPPDAALRTRAKDGSLRDASVRREEAKRLLQSAKARVSFNEFAAQWLGISGLPFLTRDDPSFTVAIRSDMLEETQRFFADQVFDQKASVADLYRAETSFVSRALARYYGLPAVGQDWERVESMGPRSGLLGQGSILASYANAGEASPIKRGVFVRNRILCQDLPPPPPNVDTTIPPPAPGLTIRERLARHLAQGQQSDGTNSCFSCHQYIDKLGFGFEGFDAVARSRDFYPEKPGVAIDVSGEIKGLESLSDPKVATFRNQREMGELVAQSPRAKQCFGTQYFRYQAGRIESSEDQCALAPSAALLVQDRSIVEFMADLFAADSFINRR